MVTNCRLFTDSVNIVAFFTIFGYAGRGDTRGMREACEEAQEVRLMRTMETHSNGLTLADRLVADGKGLFTFADARARLGRSRAATGNLLKRMLDAGLIDRVRHGRYAVRQLGVLGTPSAAEDVALAVAAAFADMPHRLAYRSALDEHGLITHPSRSIQVASTHRIRVRSLSGRELTVVHESPHIINIGAVKRGDCQVSDLERSLLDAGRRPNLVGGVSALAEAITMAGRNTDAEKFMHYAELTGWASALRRIGSIADALQVPGLANRLRPLKHPSADLNLDPATPACIWRDPHWRIRWPMPLKELKAVTEQ